MIVGLPFLSGRVLGTRHLSPQGERPVPKQSIMLRFHVVTSKAKQIVDRTVG